MTLVVARLGLYLGEDGRRVLEDHRPKRMRVAWRDHAKALTVRSNEEAPFGAGSRGSVGLASDSYWLTAIATLNVKCRDT
jgi:hypothetical protein